MKKPANENIKNKKAFFKKSFCRIWVYIRGPVEAPVGEQLLMELYVVKAHMTSPLFSDAGPVAAVYQPAVMHDFSHAALDMTASLFRPFIHIYGGGAGWISIRYKHEMKI